MNIELISFVDKTSHDYLPFLKETGEHLCSDKITWSYYSLFEDVKVKGWNHLGTINDERGVIHGTAVNEAIKHSKADYIIISDSDIAFLGHNWHLDLIKILERNTITGIGYNPEKNRYSFFPTTRFFITKPSIKKLDIDFRPGRIKNGKRIYREVISDEWARYSRIPPGSEVTYDTGWQLPIKFKKNMHIGYELPCIMINDDNYRLEFDKSIIDKYANGNILAEYHYRGKPLLTHRKAGRKHGIDSKTSQLWRQAVETFIGL